MIGDVVMQVLYGLQVFGTIAGIFGLIQYIYTVLRIKFYMDQGIHALPGCWVFPIGNTWD